MEESARNRAPELGRRWFARDINADTEESSARTDRDVDRLARAEATGLRISIACRTLAVFACVVMFLTSYGSVDRLPRVWGGVGLATIFLIGLLYLPIIGSKWDRPYVKYLVFTIDILIVCALFVLIPVSPFDEVAQIIAFRAYGIYYLLPFVGLACLSLSWGLVAWTGGVIGVGWWAAYIYVIAGMERTLSWGDLPRKPTAQDYENVFLSPDFIGIGNRVEETAFVIILSLILAVAVYRARELFFAQLRAEQAREAERIERERASRILGQYVPETIAQSLLDQSFVVEPQVRRASILVADIQAFSSFAADRDAREVIETLNDFLAECADTVSANGGVVISYLGDGLLASFNTPLEVDNPAAAALDAARALHRLSADSEFGGQRLTLRIGVATGDVASGIVGSSDRQAFTVYGDTVNRAARLEELNKTTGTNVLMDQATRDLLPGSLSVQSSGEHVLRGLAEPVTAWSLGSD